MEAREMHVRHREEGTKPSGRSEQDMHRDKDKHDHTDFRAVRAAVILQISKHRFYYRGVMRPQMVVRPQKLTPLLANV